jgi:multisubunit Na+/H+ antiporter MnhB subunit
MDPDLAFILGLVIACFAIPAVLSAYSESRPPYAPAVIILIAVGLILYGVTTKPGGFAVKDIPDTFFAVFSRFMP